MTFGVTFSQSANGRVFDKSVGDIVCCGRFIVHQDARYHATTFKTSEKSTALDVISLVACNLLHEIKNPRHKGNGIRCEICRASRCTLQKMPIGVQLIGIVFRGYYRIICVLFFVRKMFPILLEYLKFHQMHQVIVVCFLQHSSNHQHIFSMPHSSAYYHLL